MESRHTMGRAAKNWNTEGMNDAPSTCLKPATAGHGRYSRQMQLPQFGPEGQRKLGSTRMLVVGAGGLGSPVIEYLAAAGVGTLGIIDDDVVEESNLHRQVIHGMKDRGAMKVASAAARVADLSGGSVQVVPLHQRLSSGNARQIIADYDIVIDGADNFPTRYLVSDICTELGKPVVWGSVLGFDAQVSVFWAGQGPTLRDVFPTPPPPGAVPSCGEAGVIGALCGQAGSIMAMEAIKVATGMGTSLLGRLLVIDALNARFTEVPLQVTNPPVQAWHFPEVSVAELLSGSPLGTYIDVREPDEFRAGHIPGALLFPVGEIAERIDELPVGNLLIYCRSGARAQHAAELIAAVRGEDIRLVGGSFMAWERQGGPVSMGDDI